MLAALALVVASQSTKVGNLGGEQFVTLLQTMGVKTVGELPGDWTFGAEIDGAKVSVRMWNGAKMAPENPPVGGPPRPRPKIKAIVGRMQVSLDYGFAKMLPKEQVSAWARKQTCPGLFAESYVDGALVMKVTFPWIPDVELADLRMRMHGFAAAVVDFNRTFGQGKMLAEDLVGEVPFASEKLDTSLRVSSITERDLGFITHMTGWDLQHLHEASGMPGGKVYVGYARSGPDWSLPITIDGRDYHLHERSRVPEIAAPENRRGFYVKFQGPHEADWTSRWISQNGTDLGWAKAANFHDFLIVGRFIDLTDSPTIEEIVASIRDFAEHARKIVLPN